MAADDAQNKSEDIDPLTAPVWEIVDDDDVLLAPKFEELSTFSSESWSTSAPVIPTVDEILSGEYTGWVPIIKDSTRPDGTDAADDVVAAESESPAVVDENFDIEDFDYDVFPSAGEVQTNDVDASIFTAPTDEVTEPEIINDVDDEQRTVFDVFALDLEDVELSDEEIAEVEADVSEILDAVAAAREAADLVENQVTEVIDISAARVVPEQVSAEVEMAEEVSDTPTFDRFMDDPDVEIVSPAQALEEARRRIDQMRASLQVNISRVAESFEHPIFTPPTDVAFEQHTSSAPVEPEIVEPVFVRSAPVTPEQPVIPAASTAPVTPRSTPVTQDTFEQTFDVPRIEEPKSPATAAAEPAGNVKTEAPAAESQLSATQAEHSLELVIMRDEIQDLRQRLDSSQRLIEDLTIRLANLAELALRQRD